MKKYIKYLFLVLLSLSFVNAEPEIDWIQSIKYFSEEEEVISEIITVKDGYVLAAPRYKDDKDSSLHIHGVISKYNFNGKQEWFKIFEGNSYTFLNSVKEVEDGYVAVGRSGSTNMGFKNKGLDDAVIVKYDLKGNQQWINNFGGSDLDYFKSVIVDEDGYVAVGYSRSKKSGFHIGSVIVKYDKEGNQKWGKNLAGSNREAFNSIINVCDGYVVVGYSESTDAGFVNKGEKDAIIVKYDKDGNKKWIKSFGGSSYDEFSSVIEVEDGYLAVGYSDSTDSGFVNKGGKDAIIVKYDKEGNREWVKNFGGSDDDYFKSLIETEDEYIITGQSYSSDAGFINKHNKSVGIIIKYDKEGNQKEIYSLAKEETWFNFDYITKAKDGYVILGIGQGKDLKDFGIEMKPEDYETVYFLIIKYTDPDIIKAELNKLLEELNSLIKEEDKENKNFYDEVKKSIDNYNIEELKNKRDETKERIANLKNKIDNPDTGLKTNILILFILILGTTLIYRLSKKENYL